MGYSYNTHGTNICTHTEVGRQVNVSVQCKKHDWKIHTIKKQQQKNTFLDNQQEKQVFILLFEAETVVARRWKGFDR